jgi:enamine deaminase RidA (YjgF/YER057c/UK114 family)
MPKRFTAVVPTFYQAASDKFQFSPAVRAGSHILVSGIIGVDTHLQSQMAELAEVKAGRLGAPPCPTWTGIGVAQLGVPGALLEMSAVVLARD